MKITSLKMASRDSALPETYSNMLQNHTYNQWQILEFQQKEVGSLSGLWIVARYFSRKMNKSQGFIKRLVREVLQANL